MAGGAAAEAPWAGRHLGRCGRHRHAAPFDLSDAVSVGVILLAAATLPVGFAVADLTGVRPLGGLVLLALTFATLVAAKAPPGRSAAWLLVVGIAFALSHRVAGALGTWGAVAAAAALVTAAAAILLRSSSAPSGRGTRGPRAGRGRP